MARVMTAAELLRAFEDASAMTATTFKKPLRRTRGTRRESLCKVEVDHREGGFLGWWSDEDAPLGLHTRAARLTDAEVRRLQKRGRR